MTTTSAKPKAKKSFKKTEFIFVWSNVISKGRIMSKTEKESELEEIKRKLSVDKFRKL